MSDKKNCTEGTNATCDARCGPYKCRLKAGYTNPLIERDFSGILSIKGTDISTCGEFGTCEDLFFEIVRLRDFNQRLMKELSQHGWGDFHLSSGMHQDSAIVALLEEGGFQYERVETIDINTEPNVFERDPEPGTERAEIHTTNTQTPIANYKFPWKVD